jgi:DUF4097 and DUF4098 domain-containing protein YvlB
MIPDTPRNRLFSVAVASLLAVGWISIPLAASRDDATHKRVEREAAVQGRSVSISTSVSNLTVEAGTDDRLRVTGKLDFWSNVDEWTERAEREFDVRLSESSDRIEVSVVLPDFEGDHRRKVKTDYDVKLSVLVPPGTALDIDNRYGDVTVVGIGGPARIVNNSGQIRFGDGSGHVELNGRYGAIHASDVDGELQAETTSGEIVVDRVSGNASLETRYAGVRVNGVGGRLEVSTTSGAVEATDVEGDAGITNSYANVTVERIGGRLDVTTKSGGIVAHDVGHGAKLSSSYGAVEARQIGGDLRVVASSGPSRISDVDGSLELEGSYADAVVERIAGPAEVSVSNGGVTADGIGGDLTVTCSYGTVRASRVEGDLRVNASSTGVQAKQISGSVDVETTFAGVTVVGAGGAVSIRNENGSISVKGLSGEALSARHVAETTYADIDFRWPDDRSLSYRLESSYGHLDCDFPGKLDERGSRYTLEGSTGAEGADVSLTSKSGSVRLRRE